MNSFLGIFGVFDRVARLREEPLLADIYAEVDSLRNSNPEELLSERQGSLATKYVGPEKDKENFYKDRLNMASDFRSAFRLAKQRLGA
ncbi:hypothetical protein R83H12_01135 [Fibrobacteria bacterium R8-3-H12]